MKPLSMDLRVRIVEAVEEGKQSMRQIAERFSVSHQMVQKLKYQWRDLGTLEPLMHRTGRKRKLTESQCERLAEFVRKDPGLTLEQLRAKLGVKCCIMTIWNELRRQGITHKKNSCVLASSNALTFTRSV